MLAEPITPSSAPRALGSSRALPTSSCASEPDFLERPLHALDVLRALAEQTDGELSGARADACAALFEVDAALEDFYASLEHQLYERDPVRHPFSPLLTEHARRCAAGQRADVARLCAQAARPEISLTRVLRAAWALALVTRVEVAQLAQLAHGVRLLRSSES